METYFVGLGGSLTPLSVEAPRSDGAVPVPLNTLPAEVQNL